MLCVMLKEGEYFMLGDDIKVMFIEDSSSKEIKLGIEAPKSVRISRDKLYEEELRKDPEANAAKLREAAAGRKYYNDKQRKEREKKRNWAARKAEERKAGNG